MSLVGEELFLLLYVIGMTFEECKQVLSTEAITELFEKIILYLFHLIEVIAIKYNLSEDCNTGNKY